MASNALTFSSSPLLLSNKAASSQFTTRFGAQSLALPSPEPTKSSTRLSLVVRAQQQEGGLNKETGRFDPLILLHLNKKVAMIDTSPYMRTPWNTTEDENDIRMWFDVPGLAATDIDVNIIDNMLVIKGAEGVDAFGRKIYSPFDCKLHLPFNCAKDETQAVLKNGVLYISMPKITKIEHMKFIHVPVRAV